MNKGLKGLKGRKSLKGRKGLSRVSPRGFTLVELLIVIAIIGILAAVILVSLASARARARDARRKSDIDTIKTAIEMYADAHQMYPSFPGTDPATGNLISCGDGTGCRVSYLSDILKNYLQTMPHDPIAKRKDTKYDYQYVKSAQAEFGYGLLITWDDGTSCITGSNLRLKTATQSGWWGKTEADICK